MTGDGPPPHPARFAEPVLDVAREVLLADLVARDLDEAAVLDPFAGVGGIHALAQDGPPMIVTAGVELEPEWAEVHPWTEVGDACALRFDDAAFDAIVTSPCYGNRMSDHHEAKDDSERRTYRHKLGRPLTPGNAGAMPWGKDYRTLHTLAWHEAWRVLRPGGLAIVNVSNFLILDVEQRVVEFHLNTWLLLGAILVEARRVPTPRYRYGANGAKRVEGELVLVLRRPA